MSPGQIAVGLARTRCHRCVRIGIALGNAPQSFPDLLNPLSQLLLLIVHNTGSRVSAPPSAAPVLLHLLPLPECLAKSSIARSTIEDFAVQLPITAQHAREQDPATTSYA